MCRSLLCVACLVLAGCGGADLPLAHVSGTVTVNGQPLTTGSVQFIPEASDDPLAVPATAEIHPDGTFVLTTAGQAGALVGWHKVRVSAQDESQPGAPWLIPLRYNRPEESGLREEVKASQTNEITLRLTSP